MKTSRFIMTMEAALMLTVFSTSCALAPVLSPPAATPNITAAVQATFEPYPASATPPTAATLIEPTAITPTAITPTAAPKMTYPTTLTPIPASWKTFSDSTLKMQFQYPAEWQANAPLHLSGTDGFVEVSLLDYHTSFFDVMRTVCVLEANTDRPAAYGANPKILDWQSWDPEHQTPMGRGCIVMPFDGLPTDGLAQAVLFARFQSPQMHNKLLVLRADEAHFSGILSTLSFQDYPPPTPSSGYYNSPACDAAKVGLPQVVLRTEALVITETAIANKNCDPWLHFDGFQNLVNSSGLQTLRRSAILNDHTKSGTGNTAGIGDDLMGYEYASFPLFPAGAPSQVNITRNGQVVDNLAIANSGPAGYPVRGFWSWKEHWLLEMDSVVVQDGELLNHKLKYAEMFEWHLMNDEPFYFFQKDLSYGISYAGQELPLRYDDIIHGQLCCSSGVYSIISTSSEVWFYALKGDLWYMVQAQLK